MVMRVGGLATGMDIEAMVNKLMEAERMPLIRMQQDQTKLEWQRDAFRDINRALLKLDDLMLDMKLSHTWQSKATTSSKEGAITATAKTSSSAGAYLINVTELATTAMNVGATGVNLDDSVDQGTITFATYGTDGARQEHNIEVEDGDTIGSVLAKITNGDNNVRAFYDSQTERVILETTRTGKYNKNGPEIDFSDDSFFTNILGLTSGKSDGRTDDNDKAIGEIGGTNAKFIYNNGLELESKNNSYELNGINFQFNEVTNGNAVISVTDDIDHTFDQIMKFVKQYNEVVEALNISQQEQKYRDFPPLTDEQKEEMTEKQIEQWEEKAKSGILRGESVLSNGLFSMRQGWYSNVETGGEITNLTQIGIKTSPDYLDGGKLVVDEEALKQALRDDLDGVQKLFSSNSDGNSRGLVNRLEDAVSSTMKNIEKRAGKEFHTHNLDNYMIGKRMKDLNERISAFEARMVQVESRYWNQFTQMEKAIQRMNDQSSYLFSQFGGGM